MSSDAIKIIALPSWIFPSANAIHFDNAGDLAIPAIGVEADVLSFPVPNGFNGVIKEISNAFIGGGFVDGGGSIVWRVTINTVAVRGKENILNSLGSIAQPSRIGGGGFIRLIENNIVALRVLNVSVVVAGQLIAGRLSGWFYPKDEDPPGIWF